MVEPTDSKAVTSDATFSRQEKTPTNRIDIVSGYRLLPGWVLAGRFEIVRALGRGGMGEVYEARDREMGEAVALKTIRPDVASDASVIARFRREIQLARRVSHPNVCRVHDIFQAALPDATEVLTFLAMELLPGETLSEYLQRRGRIGIEDALPILKQIAEGLAAAHDAGVVHRDFKSGNVMLVSREVSQVPRAVVTDFGLARETTRKEGETITSSGEILGSPAYMAPEQVEGGEITPAADIYAFGIVIYEMLTGVRPFDGPTPVAVALRRLKEAPTPPHVYVRSLLPEADAAILRCLERDPKRRWQSVRDVLRHLEAPSPRSAVSRWRGPRSGKAYVFAVLIVAAAVMGVFVLRRSRVAPGRPSDAVRTVVVWQIGSQEDDFQEKAKPMATWLSTLLSRAGVAVQLSRYDKLDFRARFAAGDSDGRPPDVIVADNYLPTKKLVQEGRLLSMTYGVFDDNHEFVFLVRNAPAFELMKDLLSKAVHCEFARVAAGESLTPLLSGDDFRRFASDRILSISEDLHDLSPAERPQPSSEPAPRSERAWRTVNATPCGFFGGDSLRFVLFSVSGVGKNTLGLRRGVMLAERSGKEWVPLFFSTDPVTISKESIKAAVEIATAVRDVEAKRGAIEDQEAPKLLGPPDREYPAGKPGLDGKRSWGEFRWHNPNSAFIGEIAEFTYESEHRDDEYSDARLFFFSQSKPSAGKVSAGSLWSVNGPWKWRVCSVGPLGQISCSGYRTFVN